MLCYRKLSEYSKQGFNIAFIGSNVTAQTACAEYLKRTYHFKRLNMEDMLNRFLKTQFGLRKSQKLSWFQKMEYYDALYRVNPEIFSKYTLLRMEESVADTVIWNVRYISEMKALQEADFIICRVTHNSRRTDIGKYVKTAAEGSVSLALQYDKSFATRYNADYSVNWESKATTSTTIDPFLERIGYKI